MLTRCGETDELVKTTEGSFNISSESLSESSFIFSIGCSFTGSFSAVLSLNVVTLARSTAADRRLPTGDTGPPLRRSIAACVCISSKRAAGNCLAKAGEADFPALGEGRAASLTAAFSAPSQGFSNLQSAEHAFVVFAGSPALRISTRVELEADPDNPRGLKPLDVSCMLEEGAKQNDTTYELYAVVQHLGATPFSGHYVACLGPHEVANHSLSVLLVQQAYISPTGIAGIRHPARGGVLTIPASGEWTRAGQHEACTVALVPLSGGDSATKSGFT